MTATAPAPVTMSARPSITASVLGVAVGTGAMAALGVRLVPTLAIVLGAILLVAAGRALYDRGYSVPGVAVAVVGVAGCALAVGLAASHARGTDDLLRTVPGVLGVALLALAVVPVRGSGTRWLVKAGAGGLFLSVALAGLFQAAPLGTLLPAMAGTILAWDAGEHAIDVGRQLGRAATTWRLDVAHVGTSALVGGAGVLVGHGVAGMRAGATSLQSFALVFLALLVLVLALHR